MKRILMAAAIAAALPVAASATTFTTFSDRASFEAALLGLTTYDFNSGAPAASSGLTITGADVSFSNGRMRDVINQGSNIDTTFAFAPSIVGFGGDFNLSGPGGAGTGISVQTREGATVNLLGTEISRFTNGFFGFISSDALASVSFFEGTQANGVETYFLDNLTTGAAPVPLPAGGLLLAAGLAGVAALRRRNKTTA